MTTKSEYSIDDTNYPRISYGNEQDDWGASRQPCSSCGVTAEQLHHVGCFVERCPRCGGQVMSCRCNYFESFERHPMSRHRRVFYKLFYLAFIPACLTAVLAWLLPFSFSMTTQTVLVTGIPVFVTMIFWNRIGEIELNQLFVTPKGEP